MRYVLPVLAGRLARALTRLRGGGSAFPGWIVNRLAPSFMESLGAALPHGIVFVLGSNGKSTTTHYLASILRAHGLRVFTNPSGSNLPQGVTSAMLPDVDWRGRLKADVAVLEIDEAYAVDLARRLRPAVVLALNVQVDQLYRFYETELMADMQLDALALAGRAAVVNADDEYLVTLPSRMAPASRSARSGTGESKGPAISFFGVAEGVLATARNGLANAANFRDGRLPRPALDAEVLAAAGGTAALRVGGARIELTLPARGLHYAVDAAAAALTAREVVGERFSPEAVAAAFAAMKPAYGRGELLDFVTDHGTEQVEVTMYKNGPSLQLNLDALDEPPEQLLMAIDEGTPDMSWIYDVDFSAIDHVDVVSGEKGWQIALALGYRGIPVGVVEPDLRKALGIMRRMPAPSRGRKRWFVNYELMFEARRLVGRGDLEVAREAS